MTTHKPHIRGDGLWAEHDQACAVYWKKRYKAVYDCNRGIFAPSWQATQDGWMLVRATGWRAKLIKLLCN